jgi:hypothetical protein
MCCLSSNPRGPGADVAGTALDGSNVGSMMMIHPLCDARARAAATPE